MFWEETPEKISPYGNRGIGEHSMIAVAPALNNAIFDALGVRLHSYPATREKVYRAVKLMKNGGSSDKDIWQSNFVKEQDYESALKEC